MDRRRAACRQCGAVLNLIQLHLGRRFCSTACYHRWQRGDAGRQELQAAARLGYERRRSRAAERGRRERMEREQGRQRQILTLHLGNEVYGVVVDLERVRDLALRARASKSGRAVVGSGALVVRRLRDVGSPAGRS